MSDADSVAILTLEVETHVHVIYVYACRWILIHSRTFYIQAGYYEFNYLLFIYYNKSRQITYVCKRIGDCTVWQARRAAELETESRACGISPAKNRPDLTSTNSSDERFMKTSV